MSLFLKALSQLVIAAVLLYSSAAAYAQTPVLVWQKMYGHPVNQELSFASGKLSSNLFVHGGRVYFPGSNTFAPILIFTNASGDSLYSNTILSINEGTITGITVNSDGSFVVCGNHTNAQSQDAIFLFKANQLGVIIWQKSMSSGLGGNRQQIIAVPDGYLIISDFLVNIIKTDLFGNQKWQKTYGQPSGGHNITPLPDGSYLAIGITVKGSPTSIPGFYRNNYWALKLRPNGDTIFTKVIGTPTNYEKGNAVVPTTDGGVVVAGTFVQNISQSKRQGQVLKLDSLLNLNWEIKIAPGNGNFENGCEFFSVQPTLNGDYVVAGQNLMTMGTNRGFLARISPPATVGGAASINWSQFYDPGFFRDMLFESDGSALIGGSGGITSAQVMAVKVSSLGQPYKPDFCVKPPVSSYSYLVKPDSIVITNGHKSKAGTRYGIISKWEYLFGDGNSFVTYDSLQAKRVAYKYSVPTMFMFGNPVKLIVTNNLFCTDTLTLYPFGGGPTGITEATAANVEVKLYPNPLQQESTLEIKNYTGKEKLHLEVTDMLGRKVALPSKQLKANQWLLQRGSLSKGLYVYRLVSSNKVVAQGKVVISDEL